MYKWYNNNIYKLIVKKQKSLDCALFCCKAHRNWLEHEESAGVAGAKGGGGGGGRKVRKRSIKREGSACYKSRCFFYPAHHHDNVNCQNVTYHRQGASQHGPNLITLITGNCKVETLFSCDIIIERNKTFLLFLQQTQQIQTTRSFSFFYDKQCSVSYEYT